MATAIFVLQKSVTLDATILHVVKPYLTARSSQVTHTHIITTQKKMRFDETG